MHGSEAGKLGGAHRADDQGGDATGARSLKRDLPRDRRLSAAVPGIKRQVFSPRRNFATALGRKKKRPCEGAASEGNASPVIWGPLRIAARSVASPLSCKTVLCRSQ